MSWSLNAGTPRWSVLVLAMGSVALSGCVAPVEESGRPCPCSTGWRCCAGEGVCVREGASCRAPFPTNPRFEALGDGEAIDLGPFTCEPLPGEGTGACRTLTDGAALRYDSRHHLFFMLGSGATADDALYQFDPQTLQWSALYRPTPCGEMTPANYDALAGAWRAGPGATWPRPLKTTPRDMLTVVPELGELVLLQRSARFADACSPVTGEGEGQIAHFSVDAGAWSFAEGAQVDGLPEYPAAYESYEWDPPSQRLVGVGQAGLYLYDPRLRTKARFVDQLSAEDLGYSGELVFAGALEAHYYFNPHGRTVFRLELDRAAPFRSTLASVPFTGPAPAHPQPGYAWDEHSGVIGGAVRDGEFFTFDPATLAFAAQRIRGPGGAEVAVGTMQPHALAYDPINNIFVFVTTLEGGFRTWAYRHRR